MSFESFENDLRLIVEFLTLPEPPPPWWAHSLHKKLDEIMTQTTINQEDLDAFTTRVTSQVSALTDAAGSISDAAGTLGGYIQQLLANQATPLPAADESGITAALDQLDSAQTALSTATSSVTALEPPVTAPVDPNPPVTPVDPTPPVTPPVDPTPPVTPTDPNPPVVDPTNPPVTPPVDPTVPVDPTSPGAVVVAPADPTVAPVQAGTLDPSTQVVEVPQGVVPVVVPTGAQPILAGSLPADSWVTPVASA